MIDGLRVLVPLDGSPDAESILGAIMPEVRRADVAVALLRAVDDDAGLGPAREYLDRAVKALEGHGVRATSAVRRGRAADSILDFASIEGASLVAMATRRAAKPPGTLLGSVTAEVLRRAQVPLLVKRPEARFGNWRRVLVALDGSENSREVLPDALRVAGLLGSTVFVVRAVDDVAGDAGPELESACARMSWESGVETVPVLRSGSPSDVIVRVAEEYAAGLICMTTQGQGGQPRARLGSVAEDVLRRAPCPVFVRRNAAAGTGRERPTRSKIRAGEPLG